MTPFEVARTFARCAALAEQDPELKPAEREELAGRYADQAVASLQQAIAAGFSDVDHIVSDSHLERLQSRGDVQALLNTLDTQGRKKEVRTPP